MFHLFEKDFDVISYECCDESELYKINEKVLEYTGFKKEAILHNRIVNGKTGEKNNKVIYSVMKK